MIKVTIDSNKDMGKIKPVHGVNNGPVAYGSLVDVSEYYKEIKFPYVRLHDTNWPHPREADIYSIFPDFSKDPGSPSSYDFSRTDAYIKSIIDAGSKIVYRLGVSIEHTKKKYYIDPPGDYCKWAKICIGIIKHYNDRWAKGFKYNIKYWEIWNEPEGFPGDPRSKSCMWSGTHEQYLKLYNIASRAIKKYDPLLKVGGFAATMVNPEFNEKFLSYCRKNRLPLDFFSWHTYTGDPDKVVSNALGVKYLLNKNGYSKTESHFNEWNYAPKIPGLGKVFRAGNEYNTERFFERMKSNEAASFVASVLILLQDLPVDVANFYDAAPSSFWSFFNCYGVPQKNYYAFKAFKALYEHSNRVSAEITPEAKGVYCCAGVNNDRTKAAVLISNFDSRISEYGLNICGLRKGNYICEKYLLDSTKNLELESSKRIENCSKQKIILKKHSVVLLKIKRV